MELTALVTGGNRGIGFEICRQLGQKGIHVFLGCRKIGLGRAASKKLQQEGLSVDPCLLDVTKPASVARARDHLKKKSCMPHILVNNAGVLLDSSFDTSFFKTPESLIRTTMESNLLGPLRLCQAFVPAMKKRNYGRVVNMSSGAGQLVDMNSGFPAYRFSKTAFNALTRVLADELKETNILVNSMCPGWVNTRMGGSEAPRTPAQGADTAVWLATLPASGPRGGFFRDRESIPW